MKIQARVNLIDITNYRTVVERFRDRAQMSCGVIAVFDELKAEIKIDIETLDKNKSELFNSLPVIDEKIKNYKIEINRLRDQIAVLKNELAVLSSELSNTPRTVEITDEDGRSIKIPNPEYESLKIQMETVNAQLAVCKGELNMYEARLKHCEVVKKEIQELVLLISKRITEMFDCQNSVDRNRTVYKQTLQQIQMKSISASNKLSLAEKSVNSYLAVCTPVISVFKNANSFSTSTSLIKNVEKLQYECIEKVEKTTDLYSLDSQSKGNYAEMKVNRDLAEKGYNRISLETVTDLTTPTGPGIDGVFINKKTGQILIVETKFNKSELGNTLDGKQMSSSWIEKRLDSAVGKEMADKIRLDSILNPDSVQPVLAKVDLNRNVSYFQLDSAANNIGGIEL